MRTIGSRIQKTRIRLGFTRAHVDGLAQLSEGHTAKIERGGLLPAASTIEKIARALGVEPSWLMFGSRR